jgi:DNA-binding CsgD family transcriptional regulator/tetratricopeptide (TPR) repeat protein
MPLAIELAAARVGVFSVEQIAERLKDSLKLLRSGSRTVARRQQTLRGTLNWSHKLLSDAEKELFERLCVFSGGWTMEAAEMVCSADDIERDDILDIISSLVDKSLIVVETGGEGRPRYRMLEPVRQYAREKLEESGGAELVRQRHAAFFLALAEKAEPELRGPNQREWLEQLETEHDNLRAAFSWALERRETELALRLGGALCRFWERRGHRREGRGWLQLALTQDGVVASAVRAKALSSTGILIAQQGDYREARTLFHEALGLYQELDNNQGVAESIMNLGRVTLALGKHEWGVRLLKEALRQYRRLDDKFGTAEVLFTLGHAAKSLGDYEQAQTLFEESLRLLREVGDHAFIAICLSSLGWVVWRQGERDLAARLLEEGLERFRKVGLPAAPIQLLDLAHIMLGRDDLVRAKEFLDEGLALARLSGNKPDLVMTLEGIAMIEGVQGEAERVARLWGAAEASREDMNSHLFPNQRTLYEPYLDAARAKLGETLWEATLAEGRAMTLEEATEYALMVGERAGAATSVQEQTPAGRQPSLLTQREEEIATIVARGLTNRQIASELVISEHTVATHIRKILKKLGLHSRSQLTAWMAEQGSTPSDLH